MANTPDLWPSNDPARAGSLAARTLGAVALATAFLATISAATLFPLGEESTDPPIPAFLTEALSAPVTAAVDATPADGLRSARSEAPLTRRAAPGVVVQISPTGFSAASDGNPIARAPKVNVPGEKHRDSHPDAKPHALIPDPPNSSISLAAEGTGRGAWERYANGASRSTGFGRQTIVISEEMIEEFLTVHDRHGLRTWRWRIGADGLTPRVGDDGSVGFLRQHRLIDMYIEPVRIFDARGGDITPAGLRWSLAGSGNSRWLELRLDDSALPLPYVIDPGIVFRSAVGSDNGAGNTSVSLTVPAGVAANDLLLAQVSVRGTPTITPPAGWTLIRTDSDASAVARQAIYYRQATSGEPSSYSWTLSANAKAAGGILAYAGVDLTAPINAHGGASGASGVTTAPSITTTAANTMVVAFFAKAIIANYNVSTAVTLRYRGASSGGANASNITTAAGDVTQAGAGATGTKTIDNSNCNAREWIGQIVALKVDATPPSPPAQSISESGPDSHASSSTFFYRPAGTGGSFTVTSTTTDGESGIKQVRFPALSGGMTPTALVDDTTSPYSQVYTWSTSASESGAKTVTASDGADNTSTGTFTITPDSVAPTGGALTVKGVAATGGGSQSYHDGSTFTIGVRTDYTETLNLTNSGLASSTLTRENGTLSADACSAYGAPTTLVGTPTQGPFATGCYRYVLTGTDNVGNAVSVTTVVKVDTSAPGAPSITLADTSADVHTTGTTAFYRPAGTGSFNVSASATDAQSGILDYSFPALAGFTSSGSGATKTYTLATPTEPDGAKSVTARNQALLVSPAGTFTLTADAAVPTGGALTVNGTAASGGGTQSYDTDGSFAIGLRTDYTDGGSGIGSSTLTREDGTLSGDTCSAYGAPASLIGTPAQSGLTTGCYRYELRGTDNVGNTVSITTVVKVDTSDPSAPDLTLADTSAAVHTTGTTAYYRPSGSGSFDVTASSTDADTNVPSYSFPALAGFATSGSGASRTYTLATPTESDGAKTVTALNNAGRTNSSTFTLTADAAAPTGGALTVNGTAASGGGSTSTSSGSFSISRTDYADALAGIATSTLTRDSALFTNDGCGPFSGSPTTIVGAPAQSLPAGCYQYVLTGTDAVGNTASISTVVQVHGAATQISLTGSTANLTSGDTRVLTATIRDASGNTVTADSSTVVAFAQASGAGTVTSTGNATALNGVATKTITGVLAGPVSMEATSAGLTTGTLAFTVVHGAATQISLSGATTDLTSGATRILTATIQDAAGNTVTSDNTTSITFTQAAGTGSLTGTGAATASSGVATKTVTGALVGSVTMQATATGLTTGSLGAFTVVHGAATQISLAGSTANLTSGTNRLLTATIQDAAGNTVTSDNATSVTFAQPSGTGSVTGSGAATASGGVATKTITGALAGPVTMEATATGLTTGTLGAFTVVHGAATQISLSGSTANLTSGASRVLTATIQDAAGNTVTSDNTTSVAFAKQSGAGSVSGTGSDVAVAGVATKTVTGVLAGAITLEATATGLTTNTLTFTVVHGAATQISLSGATTDLTSGATRILTATIQDAAGNTVTSDSTTSLAFAQASGAGSVSGTGPSTASSGVATKTVTGVLAGSVTMQATATGLTTGALGAFTVVHGAAADIVLTGSTANLTSGDTRVLTATIRDAAGNTVTSDNTTSVTFAQASGTGTVTGSGAATASGGVATKTVTGALAGPVTMQATATGLTTGTLGAFTVVHGTATQISLSGSTANLASDATRVLTATIQDAAGNTVTSDNTTSVAFAKQSGAGSVSGTGSDVAVAGVATKTVTGVLAGAITLEATATGLTTNTLTFTVVHGAATAIDLAESGSTVAGATHTLTATIRDAAGNAVTSDSSTVVTFAKTGGAGTVTGLGSATAASGVATLVVTNRLAGAITVEATSSGLTAGSAGWTIVTGSVSDADSTVVASPVSVMNNGAEFSTITVTLRDAGGNPVAGKTVTLAQGAGSSTITGGGSTDAAGTVTFSVSNTKEEVVTYTASDTTDSIVLTDTAEVSFVFSDVVAPTNTITLASATGALLSGTTLWYRPSAAGSFTISSAVADSGAGPASATYPLVTRAGWTHAAETVSTPAGGPYVSSPFTWTNAVSGNFTIGVTAADAWSTPNSSTTTLDVTEDSIAPALAIECDAGACSAGWYLSSPVSVTLAAPDAGAGLDQIRYTTDGTEPTFASGTVYAGAFNVAAEGVTTVKYRAFDRIGNDSGVLTQTIRIDTVAPETSIGTAPAAATQDTTPTFAFSADESSTFEARLLPGGSWSAASSPFTLAALTDGTYTFEVRATDPAGNVDATPASYLFTVDTTPADTTITGAPALVTNTTSATFSFTASDAGPSFECSLDGAPFADCASTQSYSGLAEGMHTFRVRAEDAAGNLDPTPAEHTWEVDLTSPDTTILTRPADPYGDAVATFTFASDDPGSTFRCRVDGGAWNACTSPFSTAALADGAHTFEVEATDAAGNVDASPASDSWTTDDTNPTGSVTSPANGAAVGGTAVALASNSADSGSGVATVQFQRSPAGAGTWTAQATPWDTTLPATPDGDYDLRVITTDNAGNTFTSTPVTVTVDNSSPTLSVTAPNVNLSSPDPETIAAVASDDGTGVASVTFEQCSAANDATCSVDTWTPLGTDTASPYSTSWPVPSDGTRLIRVRATDGAGRQTTELELVTVDRTRPTGSVTAPVAGADLRGASVELTATAADTAPGTVNTVTFQVSPAGAGTWSNVSTDSAAPYAATLNTTALADGLYDLRVFTTDAAGNAEGTPATVQVRVDNTDPTGEVTAPAPNADVRGTITLTSDSVDPLVGGSASGVDTVVFERSPAGANTWTTQAASFDTTTVTDGLYDVRVTTTDRAGNDFTSTAVTIRIDNTLPTGSVTAPASSANVRQTIALTSDSDDPLVAGSASGVDTVEFQRSPAGANTWTTQAASWDTTAQADGLYDVRVVTKDKAGNTFTSPAITIRVDNTAPTGSVIAPAGGSEHGLAPIALSSDSADSGSGVATVVFERSPAGANAWTATAAPWNTASGGDAVGDGDYDLRVTTTDNAGNTFTSTAVTVKVDHTAPTTSAGLAPGSPSNAPVTVSFTADDGSGSGVSVTNYRIDGGAWQSGSSAVVSAPGDHSNDGSHTVEYYSTDDVGNVETTRSVTVVIDTTAPSGSPGNPGDYLRDIANLTYTTSDTDVSSVQFEFSPAGMNTWSAIGAADLAPPYEASWNTSLVSDGPYDLRAVVTDSTGNVANELLPGLPKTVDNTDPTGSITSPGVAANVSGSVNVTASASDGASPASGVSAVRFEIRPSGAGSFSVFGTQTSPVLGSTYQQSLDTTGFDDGPADLRVVVTDVAGNETTSSSRTITIDNDAPVVTFDDPGSVVGASVALSATSSADTASVAFRYRPVGSGATGTLIGTDTSAPFGVTWNTTSAAEGQWELIAVATDGGGNVTTSAARTVLVDRTQPTGSVTSPASGATVGGPAVGLAATGADTGGSGVSSVTFEVKTFGSATFGAVGSDSSAPYAFAWDATGAPDGAAEIRAVITDAAGNVRTTAGVTVTVDSTGPSVTLADPGAVVSGTVSLASTTGGGAVRVSFGVTPAGGGSWTEIASDTSSPFSAAFDTATLPDGLYDLRAIGYDALGNPSAPAQRLGVRFDNTAPALVSSTPVDGTVSAAANELVLTASEPVTVVGATLNGAAAPAPTIAGNQLTFATGALADGIHVLTGQLEDASGTRVRFRVAVTIQGSSSSDPPPVERSVTSSGTYSLATPGGLVNVTVPAGAWPTPPTPQDTILILRVDAASSGDLPGSTFAPGSQPVEITARWATAGTQVTEFPVPLRITFSNPGGGPVLPGYSQTGTGSWNVIPPLAGTSLPADQRDGFYRDGTTVTVLSRHLTWFGLLLDGEAPSTPRDLAGVVAGDGLTLRWIPGSDSSGQLGNVILYVNGEPYQQFAPSQFEAKLGEFAPGDTRTFTLAQTDAAGNVSPQTAPLRALPLVAGKSLAQASAELVAAGFRVGAVREQAVAGVAPGTVLEPAGIRLALRSTPVDLVVARGGAAEPGTGGQTRLVFSVTGAKKLNVTKTTAIPVRLKLTRPAQVTATLYAAKKRLYSWKLRAKAGASVVKLRLPPQIRRPGTYTLRWIARSGTEVVSRSLKVTLVGPKLAQVKPKRQEVEIVLAGDAPDGSLQPNLGRGRRVVAASATEDQTFDLVASSARTVGIVVVDVDRHGLGFLRDLRTVFPSLKLIVISGSPKARVQSVKAGAVRALPRNVTARALGKAIARAAAAGR